MLVFHQKEEVIKLTLEEKNQTIKEALVEWFNEFNKEDWPPLKARLTVAGQIEVLWNMEGYHNPLVIPVPETVDTSAKLLLFVLANDECKKLAVEQLCHLT